MAERSHPSLVGGIPVYGGDDQTRCKHYGLAIDIIAIKHGCCDRYFACHRCHDELAEHPAQPWPASRFHEAAVLCGACGHEMTAPEYLATQACPCCRAAFNPGCKAHRHLYFEDLV